MEKELNEIISELFNYIDPLSLTEKNQSSNYLEKITENYSYLPDSTIRLVNSQIENFYCDDCRENLIHKGFSCTHNFCSVCSDKLENPIKCRCLEGDLISNDSFVGKCRQCLNPLKNLEFNCEHYCEKCAKELYCKGTYACPICRVNFKVSVVFGNCSKCLQGPSEVIILCYWHMHCQECARNDLKYLNCTECSQTFSTDLISKLIEFVFPICFKCYKRMEFYYVSKQPCCFENYCYLCLSESQTKNCFCGSALENQIYITAIKRSSEELFTDFNKLELSLKNLL